MESRMRRKSHVRFGKRDERNNARKLANCALVPTSPDPTPSPEDVAVTREIYTACKILDLDLLDHLVIGNPGFVSLKERGLGFG
jgi:DNA repair protein RadC